MSLVQKLREYNERKKLEHKEDIELGYEILSVINIDLGCKAFIKCLQILEKLMLSYWKRPTRD